MPPTESPAPDPGDLSASRSFSPAAIAGGGQSGDNHCRRQLRRYWADRGYDPPRGYAYVSSDPVGASFDGPSRTVSFSLIAESSLSYTVTASSTAGAHSFSGVLKDSGKVSHTIGGASAVTVEGPAGPTATRFFSPTIVAPERQAVVTIALDSYGGIGQIELIHCR